MNELIESFKRLDDAFVLQVQDPIRLAGWDGPHAPEVDIAVFHGPRVGLLPTVDDGIAFVEVSDTTYRYDRARKIPLFALQRPNGVVCDGRFEIAGVSIDIARRFAPEV